MKKSKKIIMITGGGGAGNEAIFRILSDKYELYFVDSDISNIDPRIPSTQKIQIPLASDKDFVEVLKKLCFDLRVDLLIPSVDEELLLISENLNDWGETQIMLPHKSYIEAMLDKLTMIRSIEAKEILAPETESLDKDVSKFVFPCIIKPRMGRGSRGVFSVNNIEEVEDFKKKVGNNAISFVLQRQYFGEEYTVQMIANSQSELLSIVPAKISVKKGVTIKAKTDDNISVINACRHIHQKIPCAGTYNIQLILTNDNHVYPFEINPRISTTFCLILEAGINPIQLFFDKKSDHTSLSFKNGISLSRHWYNHFS